MGLSLWTPQTLNCHQRALSNCRSLNKWQRSSWMMTAKHHGTLSFCCQSGAALPPTPAPLSTTATNCFRSLTQTLHTKRRACLRTHQDRRVCRWTAAASWLSSCPLLKPPQSSQSCTSVVLMTIKQVELYFLMCITWISLTSPKEEVLKDTAEEASVRLHHGTSTPTITTTNSSSSLPWWPSLKTGSSDLSLWPLTLDTTATCPTLTTLPAFTVTTTTARGICPCTSSLCWLDNRCPLVGWKGSVAEEQLGKRDQPSTAVNTPAAARPTPRARTSRLTSAPTQVTNNRNNWS